MLSHELACFNERIGGYADVTPLNLAVEPPDSWRVMDKDAVLIGGSGDFSVVHGGYSWEEPMLELVRQIVLKGMPMFASCFGFQVLVKALGGEVGSPKSRAEIGTHPVTLTEAGCADDLFRSLPERFDVNLGHNDSAIQLPETLIHLASSEACFYQAVRVRDAPIWATQFHPELTDRDNETRYLRYLKAYSPDLTPEQAEARSREIHRPTPDANTLLSRFLKEVGQGSRK
jgi:GMP synthase (glutamine-hydrolysing)